MSDIDKLDAFLEGAALDQLEEYMNRLGPAILENSAGFSVTGQIFRSKDVDWDAEEIVIVDTIVFRIGGPNSEDADAGPARSRSARRRQAGARRDRAVRPRNVRH